MSELPGHLDFTGEFDFPPSKRRRLSEEGPPPATEGAFAPDDEDDFDDIYKEPTVAETVAPIELNSQHQLPLASQVGQSNSLENLAPSASSDGSTAKVSIPGLGLPSSALGHEANHEEVKPDEAREVEPIKGCNEALSTPSEIPGLSQWRPSESPATGEIKLNSVDELSQSETALQDHNATYDQARDDQSKGDSPGHTLVTNGKIPNGAGQAQPFAESKSEINEHSQETEAEKVGNEEYRFDSSDLDSSSSDSSTDSDSSSDEDGDELYQLLSAEEQARLLMAEIGEDEGGGSDNEDLEKREKKMAAAQLRTKNEVPDDKVERPEVEIPADVNMVRLGTVESVTNTTILIKATTSGEYQVLEEGSIVCGDDRKIIGVVADLLGRVQHPKYTVRFNSTAEIADFGVGKDAIIFYPDADHLVKKVFTQPLRQIKGSDASNLYDEEPNENEIEFSDDEAEAEYKRKKKESKKGRGGARKDTVRSSGASREHDTHMQTDVLNYDEEDATPAPSSTIDDDTYTPLVRPQNYAQLLQQGPAPSASRDALDSERADRGNRGGRGRSDGRGRTRRGNRRRPNHGRVSNLEQGANMDSDKRRSHQEPPRGNNNFSPGTANYRQEHNFINSPGNHDYRSQVAPDPRNTDRPSGTLTQPQNGNQTAAFDRSSSLPAQPLPFPPTSNYPPGPFPPNHLHNYGFLPPATSGQLPGMWAPQVPYNTLGNSPSWPPSNQLNTAQGGNAALDPDALQRAAQEKLELLRSLSR